MPKKRPVLFVAPLRRMPLSKIQQANAPSSSERSARKILARTHAAQALIDQIAARADMTDVAHLPVIIGLPTPKPKKTSRAKVQAPLGEVAKADDEFLARMREKAPPRPGSKKPRKKSAQLAVPPMARPARNAASPQPAAL